MVSFGFRWYLSKIYDSMGWIVGRMDFADV